MILAGDIGGTKTRLGLFERAGQSLLCRRAETFANDQADGFADILRRFLAAGPKPAAACLGVAGPILDGRAQLTNRDWTIDAQEIAQLAGIDRVLLINDLSAIALGVAHLPDAGFAVLNAGSRPWARGNMAVVAPGTGLGQAATLWDGARHVPLASEAGHADFAALDDRQIALRRFLAGRYAHVSIERVLSGMGLADICDFVSSTRAQPLPRQVGEAGLEARPAAILALATQGEPICREAVEIFCQVLAAEAGNAALRFWAQGGVALAGGMPAHMLAFLRAPGFVDRFAAKGRFEGALRALPLRVVIDADVAIFGAARHAAQTIDPGE